MHINSDAGPKMQERSKKGTETHVDAYHKPVWTNRCKSFFGDGE